MTAERALSKIRGSCQGAEVGVDEEFQRLVLIFGGWKWIVEAWELARLPEGCALRDMAQSCDASEPVVLHDVDGITREQFDTELQILLGRKFECTDHEAEELLYRLDWWKVDRVSTMEFAGIKIRWMMARLEALRPAMQEALDLLQVEEMLQLAVASVDKNLAELRTQRILLVRMGLDTEVAWFWPTTDVNSSCDYQSAGVYCVVDKLASDCKAGRCLHVCYVDPRSLGSKGLQLEEGQLAVRHQAKQDCQAQQLLRGEAKCPPPWPEPRRDAWGYCPSRMAWRDKVLAQVRRQLKDALRRGFVGGEYLRSNLTIVEKSSRRCLGIEIFMR